MSENTKIEWCDHTFNPWTGCMKVGPGCDHCYAEGWSKRAGAKVGKWGAGAPRVRTSAANWKLPIKWEAGAAAFKAAHGRRQRVFCASLADVFDNEVDPQWRADLFALIRATPNLDWLLLTKRIGMVLPQLKEAGMHCNSTDRGDLAFWIMSWFDGRPPANVWLGATVVNQEEADRDIPKLLAVPARVRFLSMEPLLGAVNLRFPRVNTAPPEGLDKMSIEQIDQCASVAARAIYQARCHTVDWVIAGGESGPGARAMHPDWARSLRDQCTAAGVPFLFKQWGEWAPSDDVLQYVRPSTRVAFDADVSHVGKKAAGRLLDGITHDGFPS